VAASRLTTGQNAAVKKEVQTDPTSIGYATPLAASDWNTLAALLCQPGAAIANPTPAAQVPVPWAVADVLNALTAKSQQWAVAQSLADLEAVAQRIRAQDGEGLVVWGQVKFHSGDLVQADVDALQALVSQMHADPNWQATILDKSRLQKCTAIFGEIGAISPDEVQGALT
jgi:hypothetical protein